MDQLIVGGFRDLTKRFRSRISLRVRRRARLFASEAVTYGLNEDAVKMYTVASLAGEGDIDTDVDQPNWDTFFTSLGEFLTSLVSFLMSWLRTVQVEKKE